MEQPLKNIHQKILDYKPNGCIYTHCQFAQKVNHSCQNLTMSMVAPTQERKESTGIQHCIKAIAGEVVKSSSVHLIPNTNIK